MNDLARPASVSQEPARFTVDEFMALINTSAFTGGGKLELVDGVIVRMSPAHTKHMRYQRQVFRALDAIYGDGLEGFIAQFELSTVLRDATLRDADVGVVLAEGLFKEGFADPADIRLMVEVSDSSLGNDLAAKRSDYARAGIPHYWVVDINGRRVFTMTTPVGDDYADRTLYPFGDDIPVPGTDRSIRID